MNVLITAFVLLVLTTSTMADFYDPMRPPAFALEKLRLEKIKNTNTPKAVQPSNNAKQNWVLSSILYSKDRKHAIINNRLVRQGELIKGARLIGLNESSVRLLAKGKVIELSLQSRYKAIKKSRVKRKL